MEKYLIQEFAPNTPISDEILMRTPKCVVEAPSPGAAIEYFLAIHGMFSYHIIKLRETDIPAEETKEDVLQLIPDIEAKAAGLDQHHKWEEFDK